MLVDRGRESFFILTFWQQEESYKQLEKAVTSHINLFLKVTMNSAPELELHLDFWKEKKNSRISKLFLVGVQVQVLLTNEYKSINQMSPYFRAIIDLKCWNTQTPEVTTEFKKLVE